MRRIVHLIAITVLALAWTTTARAQAEHYGNKPIEVNAHAGAIKFEDGDSKAMFGGRIAYNMASGWGVGGNFDYVDADGGSIMLYSGEIDYTFPSTSQTHFFVGAGAGVATTNPDEGDGDSNLLIPVAAGIKWFNRTNDPTWGIRAEARDNIIHYSAETVVVDDVEMEGDSQTTNNFEFTVGLSYFLGGGM